MRREPRKWRARGIGVQRKDSVVGRTGGVGGTHTTFVLQSLRQLRNGQGGEERLVSSSYADVRGTAPPRVHTQRCTVRFARWGSRSSPQPRCEPAQIAARGQLTTTLQEHLLHQRGKALMLAGHGDSAMTGLPGSRRSRHPSCRPATGRLHAAGSTSRATMSEATGQCTEEAQAATSTLGRVLCGDPT